LIKMKFGRNFSVWSYWNYYQSYRFKMNNWITRRKLWIAIKDCIYLLRKGRQNDLLTEYLINVFDNIINLRKW
jgi:hypothetical protein